MTELSFDRNPRGCVAPAFLYELNGEPERESALDASWEERAYPRDGDRYGVRARIREGRVPIG